MLIIVRHGQTAANAAGLLLGRADPPLTETGRSQAAAAAELIGPVDRVICSPLARARETASAFSAGGQPVVDDRWQEIDYGPLDQTPLADVPPEIWATWRADPSWAPPGGESLTAVAARVAEACDELAIEAIESTVVVVSHVSPVKAAVAWCLGVDAGVVWRMFLDVGAVCRIAVGPNGPSLRSYNERPVTYPTGS